LGVLAKTYLLDVEFEHLLHVGGQFNQQHVPAEIAADVRDENGQKRARRQNVAPRDGEVLGAGVLWLVQGRNNQIALVL